MKPEAAAVTSGKYPAMATASPALSGLYLRLGVLIGESYFGPSAFHYVVSRALPELLPILRDESYPEAPQADFVPDSWGAAAEEIVVDSLDAHERLEAVLHSLDLAGSSKCSTAANNRPTVLDYHYAYEHNMITPTEVANRIIKFLELHNSKQHWLAAWSADDIKRQAAAAAARYAAGKSLSVFDGVPFVVKDSIDALPYPSGFGTKFMSEKLLVTADAPCVAVLKELGALLLGKAAMNEFGVGTHGFNTHAGSTANPHDPSKQSGGSSSGSAAAVAVGLCPIAVGTDGGGSIRIPSSFCGVVGLKPTKGRLADDHAAHGGFSTCTVTGPIANSVADAALLYSVMANINYPSLPAPGSPVLPGMAEAAAAARTRPPQPLGLPKLLVPLPKETDDNKQLQPIADLQPLKGVKIGVYPQVEVVIPELELVQVRPHQAGRREMVADGDRQGWWNDWKLRGQLNLDTRMFYANAANLTDADYQQAQRMKARVLTHFRRAFESCDVIMTPATPDTAGELPAAVATSGVYDASGMMTTLRFMQAANLTGLPALVLPAGRKMNISLPVGVQFIGKPWCESLLLRVAAALEQQMFEDGIPRPVPGLLINPIQCEKGAHPKARELSRQLWSKRYGKASHS
eukprot:gene11509-11652_t